MESTILLQKRFVWEMINSITNTEFCYFPLKRKISGPIIGHVAAMSVLDYAAVERLNTCNGSLSVVYGDHRV